MQQDEKTKLLQQDFPKTKDAVESITAVLNAAYNAASGIDDSDVRAIAERAMGIIEALKEELGELRSFVSITEPAAVRCPSCNSGPSQQTPHVSGTYLCNFCAAIHGKLPEHVAETLVKQQWDTANACPAEAWRYFDFMVDRDGFTYRRHGWYNPETRCVTQVG